MSALLATEQTESLPGWIFPPPGGFTADDLDRLPQIPPHSELIDGTLVLVTPQSIPHSLTVDVLLWKLRGAVPARFAVRREITVILGPRQRPEPDIIVLKADAAHNKTKTAYDGADVVLAVEVVSEESQERDRHRKPALYAEAGIKHFWRVEFEEDRPTVYVYELDHVTHAYVATGIYHDRLKVSVPYEIDIDLTEIERL